ncbi:hypothetical protein RND81_03G148600 [Saponaria officinalis]|uniref:GATA transcription factor n=1 Tax=Saponaria officinalis TaxID=3572 RepID=A0AAW1M0E1_SAPOF
MGSEFGCVPDRRASDDKFIVEDLLDFSNDDGVVHDDVVFDKDDLRNCNSNNSSDASIVVTPPDSGNSSFSGNNDAVFPTADTQFSGELCVPCDDLAELEWFSNFMEESFSSEDLQKFHMISGMSSAMKTRPDPTALSETRYYDLEASRHEPAPNPTFGPEMPVPGKARSKRSRAAPCNWTSRLIVLSDGSPDPTQTVSPRVEPVPGMKPAKAVSKKKSGPGSGSVSVARLGSGSGSDLPNGEVRRCLHCATDKTPQWRTGPMGPKTLCNACGVRYKSGRLVPEYRPAASPTFVLTKHSNSHRKVMELRRQKDLLRQQQHIHEQQHHHHYHHHQQQQQLINHNNHASNMLFDPANSDDYLIHQHIGPDFRQLI